MMAVNRLFRSHLLRSQMMPLAFIVSVFIALGSFANAQDESTPATAAESTPAAAEVVEELPKPKPKLAIKVGKIITSAGDPIINGTILVSDGNIEAIGTNTDVKIPDGYEVIDHSDKFAMPGLIEAHSHVGGSGDLNEMVYQTNPELRNWDQIIPHNDQLKVAIAGGVGGIVNE